MRFQATILALTVVTAMGARAEPAPRTFLDFDTVSKRSGEAAYEGFSDTTILQAPKGQIAFVQCHNFCTLWLRDGLFATEAVAYPAREDIDLERLYTRDAVLEMKGAIDVTVRDRQGGLVFPLEDGKHVAWTEDWRSEGFNAQYRMSVEQSCCVAADNPLAQSEQLWRLTYRFEEVESDRVSSGEMTFFYDPVLEWWIRAETITRSAPDRETPLSAIIIEERLAEIDKPE
ncbi:hypothetical protein [Pseudoponticoccus marisrubri]|uniref:Uncharacterized protein n=1 Tax=Pseudoponticoccus marisrubri TaxID=1685382 RepID=A0A0W7WER7_9RHOB|nr:hypothetical protein [Pseudoponticoccus marisrubri]KUF09065.1 hypothetical protein AVJ23_19250 [Pseudoponticoccus marisrubri]